METARPVRDTKPNVTHREKSERDGVLFSSLTFPAPEKKLYKRKNKTHVDDAGERERKFVVGPPYFFFFFFFRSMDGGACVFYFYEAPVFFGSEEDGGEEETWETQNPSITLTKQT